MAVQWLPVAGTRMACPPPLEELERKLLAALEATRTFDASASSKSIVFKDANGELQIALSQQE